MNQPGSQLVIDPLSVVKLTTRPVQLDYRIDLNRYFAHTADGDAVELPLAGWRALVKALLDNPLRKLVRTRVGLELVCEGDELLVIWLETPSGEAIRPRPGTVTEAVGEMTALGKANKPELAGRLDSAAGLVLDGRVALADRGTARVGPYRVEAGSCTCADFLYRGDWCKHRLAARMARHLVASGFELPRPRVETTTTPQVSAKNLALIASGKVIDDAIRDRVAYAQSSHGARTAALRMLGNGAKTLPADLAMRAGVGGNTRYEKRDTSEEEAR